MFTLIVATHRAVARHSLVAFSSWESKKRPVHERGMTPKNPLDTGLLHPGHSSRQRLGLSQACMEEYRWPRNVLAGRKLKPPELLGLKIRGPPQNG